MEGKYASLAEAVTRSLKKMRADDRFRIITFNSDTSELNTGYVNATASNIAHYSQMVATVVTCYGTNLYAGLKRALARIVIQG